MDNLAAHKVIGAAETIRAAGASLMYLPPYSPKPDRAALRKAKRSAQGSRPPRRPLWDTLPRVPDLHRKLGLRVPVTKPGKMTEPVRGAGQPPSYVREARRLFSLGPEQVSAG
jgi:hypothetical protein